MGKNNRSRRRAKSRNKRHHEHRPPDRGAEDMGSGTPASIDDLLVEAVQAERRYRARIRDDLLQRLHRHPPSPVAVALGRFLDRALAVVWYQGWQPADVIRFASKAMGTRQATLLRCAIASQAADYEQWGRAVGPEWMSQLDAEEAVRWWDPAEPWPLQLGEDWAATLRTGVQVSAFLGGLPSIPVLTAPPSQWSQMSRRRSVADGHLEPGLLAKIRALLAKAESTQFEAEAEAFTAKAQELMTRHRIDRSGVAAERGSRQSEVVGRRVGVDNPYAQAKAMLAGGIALANDCRAVWSKSFGFATVFGFPDDVDGVEELYTSLLVQANTALQREGSRQDRHGQSRTARFRRSFLIGFAARISERLQETTEETVRTVEKETGAELVPLLDSRARAAKEALNAAHSRVKTMSVSISDGEGYVAGTREADGADLSLAPERKLTMGGSRRLR